MALVVADRVKETTTTTGTGAITLAGAEVNFVAFSSVLSDGDTTYYAIVDDSNQDFEVGLGTYATSGNTLTRTTVLASSNGGSAVDLSAGSKEVFITYPAGKSVNKDASGNVALGGSITATQLDLTAQGDLRLQDASGGEYVALQAPSTVGSSFTLTLPSADGSADQALVTNGSGTLSFAAVGASVDYQEFTSSGTFTKASGVNYIYVEAIGAGGSGASGNYSGDGAQGGGGGAFVSGLFRASEVGATETVTIGAGGTSVTAGSGNNGGATSFGSLLTAKGGLGGLKNNVSGRGTPYRIGGDTSGFTIDNTSMAVAPSYAGLGGLASYKGGDTIYGGGGGGGAKTTSNVGGSSVFGGSGGTSGIGAAGSDGSAPGGGGGASDDSASGVGAVGRLRVWSW
jgi:hypothetical protein